MCLNTPEGRYKNDEFIRYAYECTDLSLEQMEAIGSTISHVCQVEKVVFVKQETSTKDIILVPSVTCEKGFLEKDGLMHAAIAHLAPDINQLRRGPKADSFSSKKERLNRGLNGTMLMALAQIAYDIRTEVELAETEGRNPIMVFPVGNTAAKHPTRLALPTTSPVIVPLCMRLAVMEAAGEYYNGLPSVPGKNLKNKAAAWVEFTAQMSHMTFEHDGRTWQVVFEMLDIMKPHKRKYEYSPNPDLFALYARYAATADPDAMKHTEHTPSVLPPSPSLAPDSVGNATVRIGFAYCDTIAVREDDMTMWPIDAATSSI